MKLYKLTDENGQTHNNTQWGENVTHTASGEGDLCGPGWIHAYTHPLLAALLNPIHANFRSPILWESEGAVGKADGGLKVGTTSLTTLKQIPLPDVTTEQRVRFAILSANATGYADPDWNRWADGWLSGQDRSKKSAWSARSEAAAAWKAAAAAAAAWARGPVPTTSSESDGWGDVWTDAVVRWSPEAHRQPALDRARAILAGTFPAERYDEELT